ncbi:capsular polysaccharide synthesis protein [Microbacterium sp. zg.Y625]|uniref:capsular polysaccharide synthesis protein n=1 Tax=Microbacterium jiangjiandongii TaxID=3049071 RepID=UPI00214BFF7E|nr:MULTISPECIES: capsular polysaccharide synthesis protein [unclassified Microbacterium]MCR2793187.1 capsular polysaccharide synthesis protein [Microbacterium sp. zg.Y625]MCR2815636.1 capsular polysaccharide synthesis protein [Microbacterium sp. zg.Y843]WIM25433.1 capsular polysaccharide synthesis protein [Microbacterium sp. zg-Y625]
MSDDSVARPLPPPAGPVAAFLAGLESQFSRMERFKDAVDPVAARRGGRIVTDFFTPRVPELRAAAGLPAGRGRASHGRRLAARDGGRVGTDELAVYCYWDAGVDQAPELVRACIDRVREVHPDARVLDAAGIRELIAIPDRVTSVLAEHHPAHFADYVRVALLEKYGGIWVDATCWLPGPLDEAILTYLDAGVVYPRWTHREIGNWFIAAVPGSLVIRLQRVALEMWWEARDDVPDYFLYHRIFETLHSLIPEFRGQWSRVPSLSSTASHLLQLSMMEPWFPGVADIMARLSIVQKLSYKYDPAAVPEGSILARLLEHRAL